MKRLILLTLLVTVIISSNAQTTIEKPNFKGTTANYIKILKIELSDTATVIDFRVHFSPGMWIRVPDDTYIQNSKGGEKLFVKSAKGIKINEEHFTPENGVNDYTLYFPPVGKDVETIDYQEAQWKIFEIELKPQEHFSIFPDALLGNWLRADGSNEWCYGFFEDFAIADGEIWKQVLISQKDDTYQLMLRKDGINKKLLVKKNGNNLLIGTDETKMELFSSENTSVPGFVIKNNEEFQLPVFKQDSAFYSGYIKGYVPQMGTTGMIYVNNILSQDQESYLITIRKDGTFKTGFPMIYPQQVYVRMLSSFESIYCEPGKTTFQFNDFSSYHDEGDSKLLFMGETAKINSDLMALKFIRFFDYQKTMDKILDMTPDEYKTYVVEIEEKEKDALQDFNKNNSICTKALQIKQMQISFSAQQNILSYNMNRESAYRRKNNVPRDQREIPLERIKLLPEFYDFITPDDLNNPLSLLAGGVYYSLINRIKFADPVRSQNGNVSVVKMVDLLKGLEKKNIELDPEVISLMEKLDECNSDEERNEVIKSDSALYSSITKEYKDVFREISMEMYMKKRKEHQEKVFAEYFNLNKGFATEIMNSQDVSHSMKSGFKPLSETEKDNLMSEISDEFILNYLIDKSDLLEKEIERKKEAFKNNTGFVVNETPDVDAKDLFDTIMKKYKGNLVFVDFWATWCGPCRSGMEKIKPLKEEMGNEKIKFVYLTNPSSPKETWQNLITDINGEHYYLTQDEWNVIAARFKVSGIPHYLLVDKTGKVVNEKVYFASSNDQLMQLFNEYLD